MRTTVEIPEDLFREVKARAARKGTTLKAYIVEALSRRVGGERQTTDRVELPLFGTKEGPPREVSSEMIRQVMEEEDLADARRFT
jgi:tRNA(Glu) U13 pseudouridine synthase TruD